MFLDDSVCCLLVWRCKLVDDFNISLFHGLYKLYLQWFILLFIVFFYWFDELSYIQKHYIYSFSKTEIKMWYNGVWIHNSRMDLSMCKLLNVWCFVPWNARKHQCANWNGIYIADVVEWPRALDIRLSDWCCSVSVVWVEILSREEQKFDSSKI